MFLKKSGDGDRDQRQIAIVRDELHGGRIFVRIAIALDREIAAVADHVRVGHDAIAVDHKAGADAALNRSGVPRRPVIGFDRRRGDANQAFLDLAHSAAAEQWAPRQLPARAESAFAKCAGRLSLVRRGRRRRCVLLGERNRS